MSDERCFVDTNILVYANDSAHPAKQEKARQLVSRLIASGQGCISSQVLAEFWVTVTRKLSPTVPEELARHQIVLFDAFFIQSIDQGVFLDALKIQQQYSLSFWDSQILAAALRARCTTLYSEDMQSGATYNGVRVVNPFKD